MNDIKPWEKLKIYEEELKLAKSSNNNSEIISCLKKLGKLCFEIKANELGLKYIEEALILGKKQSNFTDQYLFYKMLGDLYFEDGNLEEAFRSYKKSNKVLPKNQDLEFKVRNYFKLGKVAILLEKTTQSIVGFYEKAANLSKKLNNSVKAAKSYERIGVLYLDKAVKKPRTLSPIGHTRIYDPRLYKIDYLRKAKKYFKRALVILERNNLQNIEAELYTKLQSRLKIAKSDI